MTANEAAERLRNLESDDYQSDITEALAAERRATAAEVRRLATWPYGDGTFASFDRALREVERDTQPVENDR